MTVAAVLPAEWEKRLVDTNVSSLEGEDIRWADLVLISAMAVQKESVERIITRCKSVGVKIVAGGSLFMTAYEGFRDVYYLVLNEAEVTLPFFLEDLKNDCPKHIRKVFEKYIQSY